MGWWRLVLGLASGLALMAAIYPAGVLIIAIYLASPRPREAGLAFVAGALLSGLVMAIMVYFLLKSWHLDLPSRQHTTYGMRLGLGMAMIVVTVLLARSERGNRPAVLAGPGKQAGPKPGAIVSRLVTDTRPVTALAAGFVVFFFSFAFIAAVQVVATARAGGALTVFALVTVVVLYGSCAWLPYVLYLLNAGRTTRMLQALNQRLAAHGRTIWLIVLAIAGAVVAINGAVGLS